MNKEAQAYVEQFGGKNGTLLYLLDNHPELANHLVPLEVFYNQDDIVQALNGAIQRNFSDGKSAIILRPSHSEDLAGMVDHLPSLKVTKMGYHAKVVPQYLKSLNHSAGEQAPECTIGVSPYHQHQLHTITEHPNQPGRKFVDSYTRTKFQDCQLIMPEGVIDQTGFGCNEDRLLEMDEVCLKVKNALGLEDGVKMQSEVGDTGKHILFFQPRIFCDQFPPLSEQILEILEENNKSGRTPVRVMGNLPPEESQFPHIRGKNFEKAVKRLNAAEQATVFSAEHPNGSVHAIHNPHLVGFVDYENKALFHGTTGPSQIALNNGGFAILGASGIGYKNKKKLTLWHYKDAISME